jgi:hypothetical protein
VQPPRHGQGPTKETAPLSPSVNGPSTDKRRSSAPNNAPPEPRRRDRDRDSVSGTSVSDADSEDSYSSVSMKHKSCARWGGGGATNGPGPPGMRT